MIKTWDYDREYWTNANEISLMLPRKMIKMLERNEIKRILGPEEENMVREIDNLVDEARIIVEQ